ncbi:hypothetical protein ACIQWB_36595 [Streptomyces olivaceus]|uniref:hypothetical protein n=1 Tax=Streptomyces olivaceus TaxID=47716 RepID=UPI0037F81623
MARKKRAVAAAAITSTLGIATGLAASQYGLDPVEATRFGAMISGAVGNLLYQALRLTADDAGGLPQAGLEPRRGARGPAGTAISNAAAVVGDTGCNEGTTVRGTTPRLAPHGGVARCTRSRHARLERAARRRIERRRHHGLKGREGRNHGAS